MGMSSSSKSFSSSSSTMMSSSSSSTSSSKMIGGMSGMMGGGMQMPSMFDKMGAGVDFEELSTAEYAIILGTDISGPPAYTVTSPRPSVDNTASGLKFTVQPTPDFKPKAQQEADCSVLLKLKKGDEYKLVLNMQQYS